MGRPSTFTQKTFDAIIIRLSAGETLTEILKSDGMPSSAAFYAWKKDDAALQETYAHARNEQRRAWADQIVDMADNGSGDWIEDEKTGKRKFNRDAVQRTQLRIDTRKWLMERLNPEFSQKSSVDVKHGFSGMDDAELLALLRQSFDKLGVPVPDHLLPGGKPE